MGKQSVQLHSGSGIWPPTWPMGLTMLRLLLLPFFLWSLLAHGRHHETIGAWLPIAIFAIMALTDKLDGYLARRLHQTSRLGAILDPVADKLLVGCSVILLSFDWVAGPEFAIPIWVVVAVYGKDLLTAGGVIAMLAVVGKVTIAPRPFGKASTVLQLAMVLAVLIAPRSASAGVEVWQTVVLVLWWAVVVVAALSCADYLIQGFREFLVWKRTPAGAPTVNVSADATHTLG